MVLSKARRWESPTLGAEGEGASRQLPLSWRQRRILSLYLGENPNLKCAARKAQGGEEQKSTSFPWSLQTFTKSLETNIMEVQELVTPKPGSQRCCVSLANSPALSHHCMWGLSNWGRGGVVFLAVPPADRHLL